MKENLSNSPINRVHTFVPPPRAVWISECNTFAVEKHSQAEKKSVHHTQKNEPLHHKHTDDYYQYAKKVLIIQLLFLIFISFFLLPPSLQRHSNAKHLWQSRHFSIVLQLLCSCVALNFFQQTHVSYSAVTLEMAVSLSSSTVAIWFFALKLNCEDKISWCLHRSMWHKCPKYHFVPLCL